MNEIIMIRLANLQSPRHSYSCICGNIEIVMEVLVDNHKPLGERLRDTYVMIDGRKVRYIEKGGGPVVLFLHGASLGSSADVFIETIEQFADAGFRAIAFDIPGFGLSEAAEKQSVAAQRNSIPKFIDALKLDKVALMAHSRAGGFAVDLALSDPSRYSHIVILGSGPLLPPQDEGQLERHQGAQSRADKKMAEGEPKREDTLKLLQADAFRHDLITEERLTLRHSRSIGQNFLNHVARQKGDKGDGDSKKTEPKKPMWERLDDLMVPILLIYGREDRAHAAERAQILMERRPHMQIHIIPNCKHLVPWDAADEILRLSIPFLKS